LPVPSILYDGSKGLVVSDGGEMSDTPEQAELRRHLSDLRQAAHGIGRDFEIKFRQLDDKITELPHHAAKDLKYFAMDIDDDFRRLGRSVDDELSRIPGAVANAGSRIAAAASRASAATVEAFQAAGKRTKEGTKNVLAAAAGIRRTPMKEWNSPTGSSSSEEEREP
jgi:hypothetical protein